MPRSSSRRNSGATKIDVISGPHSSCGAISLSAAGTWSQRCASSRSRFHSGSCVVATVLPSPPDVELTTTKSSLGDGAMSRWISDVDAPVSAPAASSVAA